jgi:hypothetical protein
MFEGFECCLAEWRPLEMPGVALTVAFAKPAEDLQ